MRFLVREFQERGRGRCLATYGGEVRFAPVSYLGARKFDTEEEAREAARRFGGRVVRLLSHDEAKRRATAKALREEAGKLRRRSCRCGCKYNSHHADMLEKRARSLWPAPKKKEAQ